MIEKREIIETARLLGLAPHVVEKDYVLGWLLWGIHQHPRLGQQWAFKGGTCLKKCYFETYRFSEDLDFTVRDPALIEPAALKAALSEVCAAVTERTSITFPGEAIGLFVGTEAAQGYVEGRISYVGPLQKGGDAPRIRLDLSATELLVHAPEEQEVHHPYSDRPGDGIRAWCYTFEEVFAEKVRALAERARPRDLYDVIHLHRRAETEVDVKILTATLERKCKHKGIAVPTFQTIEGHPKREEMAREWENMLKHQVQALPPLEHFMADLPAFFDWLNGTEAIEETAAAESAVEAPEALPREAEDTSWVMPARFSGYNRESGWLEAIRFAGANRALLSLDYRDKKGNVGTRLIEPYRVFRAAKDGVLCLFAIRSESGEPRIYRFDGILGMTPTSQAFAPRYPVEVDQIVENRPSGSSAGFSRRRRTSYYSDGPRHIFRCPVCQKEFARKTYGLGRPNHKNKQGWDCFGHPYYIRTRY